jgi:5-methyltetrahydrofolate--homocysteine methyltransferase
MDSAIKKIYDCIISGQRNEASDAVHAAINEKLDLVEILNLGMISAMDEVGQHFESGEYFIPEMLMSARAMQAGLVILKPHLSLTNYKAEGKVVIGTVRGDLHDIGKNLVGIMLEGAGFEIMDLGVDVPEEKFIAAISAGGVDIVALSALLTTTMPNMKSIIDAIGAAGLRLQVRVIIGGAPVTEDYASQIGADGYAMDASRAVTLAKSLMQSK